MRFWRMEGHKSCVQRHTSYRVAGHTSYCVRDLNLIVWLGIYLTCGGHTSYSVEGYTYYRVEGHTSYLVERLTSYRVVGHTSYLWRGLPFIVSDRYPGDALINKLTFIVSRIWHCQSEIVISQQKMLVWVTFSFNKNFWWKFVVYSTYCRNNKYFIEYLKSLADRQQSPVHSVEDSFCCILADLCASLHRMMSLSKYRSCVLMFENILWAAVLILQALGRLILLVCVYVHVRRIFKIGKRPLQDDEKITSQFVTLV